MSKNTSHSLRSYTSTPIQQDDNWTRLPKPGQFLLGLTRSHIYQLAARGLIRTVSIRQPHHKRGIRLIYKPSIAALIAKLDTEQNGAAGARRHPARSESL